MIIVLMGYMASGKSSIGRLLAEKMNYKFQDLDDVIEEVEGLKISSIFESKGEIYFRKIDESTLEFDLPKEKALNQVFEWLSKEDIRVLSMRNKSNRLEELFVQLTEKNSQTNQQKAN